MNEFIEQFILESRELIEQASAALAALEKSPQNAEQVDATFRAIHTLKGGAAIVEFFAMERAVHVAEDALSAVRSGQRVLTPALIAHCYACLDLVSRWLDAMEQSGEVPVDADPQADHFIASIGAPDDRSIQSDRKTTDRNRRDGDSLASLPDRDARFRSRAKTTVRYVPHPDSFLRGEDPLELIAALPGLLSLELERLEQAPLSDFDPFRCSLAMTALSSASVHVVSGHFHGHADQCEIRTLDTLTSAVGASLTENARRLLEAQIALLDERESATFIGRSASAGAVVANVLRSLDQPSNADLILRATEQSLAERTTQILRDAIAKALTSASDAPLAAATIPAQGPVENVARTLRVNAERVDALVRLTGELTVVKNAIGHVLKLAEADANTMASALKRPHTDLDHLIGELQRAVLGIRVLPLRTVLQRLPRLVREISSSLDKPVKLLIEGDETEADKAIVEMLFEPLLHIVRNAMDHGIESPTVRRERNKPAVATVRLHASRQGGHVLIEVDDDGGGVDVERVRTVAKERGVVSADACDAMNDEQIVELVFAPGFSTASQITGLSGRGVGMDAVRTAAERVGGTVSIVSRPGLGTSVKLVLPFSVMLTRVMTVEAAGQLFGIPLDAVIETMSVPAQSLAGIGAARAIVRRNRTLPVFELANLMQVRGPVRETEEVTIVVAAVAGQLGGLQVDRVGERMEIMLKPLDGLLTGLSGIAGTTILGDGRVLLVLDLAEVLQ
jgi:two-component system, chemotaxis family, sensor kinase CheA